LVALAWGLYVAEKIKHTKRCSIAKKQVPYCNAMEVWLLLWGAKIIGEIMKE